VHLLRMDISNAYRICTLKSHVYKQRGRHGQERKHEDFFYRCTLHSDVWRVHSPTNTLLLTYKTHYNTHKYRSYMFRSSTIIREFALNLPEVIFTLKHSVKLRLYLLCGCVAAYHRMACVLYTV